MNYSGIKKYDVANGDGVRVSLFVSGCNNHCKGCFNSDTWDFNSGKKFDDAALKEIEDFLKLPYIKGFSLLGGDPMEFENQETCEFIVEKIKRDFPEKDIWVWTGYEMSDLQEDGKRFSKFTKDFLNRIDYLITGPFIQNKKNLMLKYRGSSNQTVYKKINSEFKDITNSI